MRKTAIRFIPFSVYEIEETANWLTDLAREGLLLKKDGIMGRFAGFQRTAPCQVRYQLTARHTDDTPSHTELELNRSFGWEHVAEWKYFNIYRTAAPNTVELETDPQVRALSLDRLRKRRFWLILLWFWFLLPRPMFHYLGEFVLTIIQYGSHLFLLWQLLFLYLLIRAVQKYRHVCRMQNELCQNGSLRGKGNWRAAARRNRRVVVEKTLCLLLWIAALALFVCSSVQRFQKISPHEYKPEIPFATMIDLAPEREYLPSPTASDHLQIWEDWLAPISIEWSQTGDLRLPNGSNISGYYIVSYKETSHPLIAYLAAQEYRVACTGHSSPMEIHLPDMDYAAAFQSPNGATISVILQDSSQVICATFWQTSEGELIPTEQWAQIVANSIRE